MTRATLNRPTDPTVDIFRRGETNPLVDVTQSIRQASTIARLPQMVGIREP
jgi:hypothetical protein